MIVVVTEKNPLQLNKTKQGFRLIKFSNNLSMAKDNSKRKFISSVSDSPATTKRQRLCI